MNTKSKIVNSIYKTLKWAAEYLILIVIFFGLGYYLGINADIKHSYSVHQVYTEDCKDDNNLDKICLFMRWADITDTEKMEAIEALVCSECYNLGLYDKLTVEINNDMPDTKISSYKDISRKILINKKYYDESDGYIVMESVIHEIFHNFQCRLVDTLEEISEEERSLTIFNSAVRFSEEFNNYNDLKKDFDRYYDLNVEKTAREWAAKRMENYSKKIVEYIKIGEVIE